MAMVKCHECGEQISSKAETCPKCGIKRPKQTSVATWIIGGVFAAGVWVTVSNHITSAPPDRQKSAREREDDRQLRRAVMAASALKQAMRNPDSFAPSSVVAMKGGAICFEYRAQNGFGGFSVENAMLSADDKLLTNSSDVFKATWNAQCAGRAGDDLLRLVSANL